MKKQAFIIIFVWASILTGWTLANPPTAKLFADNVNNVGIATSIPMSELDVNGTTTIRKSLDMTANKIINVGSPIDGTDGVPMSYVSSYLDAVSSSTTRLWGEGRPGATVENVAGQCTNTIGGKIIKISKSTFAVNWDKAAAVCPANWWVCTANERDLNGSGTAGFVKCPASGAVARQLVGCDPTYANPSHYDNLYVPAIPDNVTLETDIVWVADVGAIPHVGKAVSSVDGITKDDVMCIAAPVWCCSY